jgi:hypothetical protein
MNINLFDLPHDLRTVIDAEQVDFSVKARKKYPAQKARGTLFFGTVWTGFVSIFVIAMFGPLIKYGEVDFTANDVPTTASWDNLEPLLVPGLVIVFFVLIGLSLLTWGFYKLLAKGGYFVGTPTRFISYRNGKIQVTVWEQFTGNMEIKTGQGSGNITLQMNSGQVHNRKKGGPEFVADNIYIVGISNVLDVEKKCRARIRETEKQLVS